MGATVSGGEAPDIPAALNGASSEDLHNVIAGLTPRMQGKLSAALEEREAQASPSKRVGSKQTPSSSGTAQFRPAEKRRVGISGDTVSEDAIQSFKCPSYPKGDEEKLFIRNALMSNAELTIMGVQRFKEAEVDEMVMAFQKKVVALDQDVIVQGDEGDCLYIVEDGSFDIFVARPDNDGALGEPFKVANFRPGSIFGELALLYSARRAATVKCATPAATVWSLDREPFSMLLKRSGVTTVEQYNGWLTEVAILNALNAHEMSQLAQRCESVLFDEDEVVIQQGDEGNAFYILEDGACGAFVKTDSGEEKVKDFASQGDHFGMLDLLDSAPAKATVRTTEGSIIFKIEAEVFNDILKPIQDRLRAVASL